MDFRSVAARDLSANSENNLRLPPRVDIDAHASLRGGRALTRNLEVDGKRKRVTPVFFRSDCPYRRDHARTR